jgi:hypothetical protein
MRPKRRDAGRRHYESAPAIGRLETLEHELLPNCLELLHDADLASL